MNGTELGWWGVPLAVMAGAIRVSTPFLFVSLGECVTEKSGRVNLGLEGTLVMGAMTAYGIAYLSHSPWIGVLAAGLAGLALGALHGALCRLPKVNDIALGIALMLLGTGLAFFLGKPFIQPRAPSLPAFDLGWWSDYPQLRDALRINVLFLAGIMISPLLHWALVRTRWGMIVRVVGDSSDAALSMGYSPARVRLLATAFGGFMAGVGGAFLSLYFPGAWSESLSSGQGITAVALVIFSRWNPINCLWASLLFGGASALGPALQSVGITEGYYLFNAAPYLLTLVILVAASSSKRRMAGTPSELSVTR